MSNTIVNTNVLALNAHRNLKNVGADQAKSSQKLSSGQRINSAADDAAGLAISEKMRGQIRGLDQASRNAQDGISMIQTAEGGLQEMDNMVQRARELTVQSANDTYTTEDRQKIDAEIKALGEEITSMADRVEFNGKKLLDGSAGEQTFQVGANSNQNISISLSTNFKSVGAAVASLANTATMSTSASISANIDKLDTELTKIVDKRAELGATQNRLEYTVKSLDIASENLSASESRIRDTDMAKEMMNLTRSNVLQQAATNMLSQANQAPQNVLQLLR